MSNQPYISPQMGLEVAPAQTRVAASPARELVISGDPGVGKTRTLAARVRHWTQSGVEARRILVVTTTPVLVGDMRRLLNMAGSGCRAVRVTTPRQIALWALRAGGWDSTSSRTWTVWDHRKAMRVVERFGKTWVGRVVGRREAGEILWCLHSPTYPELPDTADRDWDEILIQYRRLKDRLRVLDWTELARVAYSALPRALAQADENGEPVLDHLAVDNVEDMTLDEYLLVRGMVTRDAHLALAINANEQVSEDQEGTWDKGVSQLGLSPSAEAIRLTLGHHLNPSVPELAAEIVGAENGKHFAIEPRTIPLIDVRDPIEVRRIRGTRDDLDRAVLQHIEAMLLDGAALQDMACLSYRPHTRERFRRLLAQRGIEYTVLEGQGDLTGDVVLEAVIPFLELVVNPRDIGALLAWHESLFRSRQIEAGSAATMRICLWLLENRPNPLEAMEREAGRHMKGSPIGETLVVAARSYAAVSAMVRRGGNTVEAIWRRAFSLIGNVPDSYLEARLKLIAPHLGHAARPEQLRQSVEQMYQASCWPRVPGAGLTLATFKDAKGIYWEKVWILDAGAADIPIDTSDDLRHRQSWIARSFYVGVTRALINLFFCYAATTEGETPALPIGGNFQPRADDGPVKFLPPSKLLTSIVV